MDKRRLLVAGVVLGIVLLVAVGLGQAAPTQAADASTTDKRRATKSVDPGGTKLGGYTPAVDRGYSMPLDSDGSQILAAGAASFFDATDGTTQRQPHPAESSAFGGDMTAFSEATGAVLGASAGALEQAAQGLADLGLWGGK
jgi:hypothetical protein